MGGCVSVPSTTEGDFPLSYRSSFHHPTFAVKSEGMLFNYPNGSYHFSSGMEDFRISDVSGKLSLTMTVDGREALSESYYPDSERTVTVSEPGDIINGYFVLPSLDAGHAWVSLPSAEVRLSLSDELSTAEYTLHVIYSRYRVSFGVLTDFLFYSRYKIKRLRQNSIDYLSFFASQGTKAYLDVIYLEEGGSVQKTVELDWDVTNRMVAYNLSPVKVGLMAGVPVGSILSYDARITGGGLSDLVRYVIDRDSHREMHQFLYYNAFGLPESISFTGLVQYDPALEGEVADMRKKKRRIEPFFNDLRTLNTGYLDQRKYKALIDMVTSPVQMWYDTPALPMEILITDIDFTHTRMGNQRVNVNLTFCPTERKHLVFERCSFSGGIFDYTFDRTFE